MKSQKKIIKMYMLLIGLYILFIFYIYFDQSYQSAIIPDKKNFATMEITPKKSIQMAFFTNLENLGFSKTTISNMSDKEINYYGKIHGKVVDEITHYKTVTTNDVNTISISEYQNLLQKYSSFHLSTLKLERVQLKLIYEGKRKFIFLTEHHFDYSPSNLTPMLIELQYRNQYTVLNKSAKQIYWTTSSFHPSKLRQGEIVYSNDQYNLPTTQDKTFEFLQSNINSSYYYVDWHNAKLFQDIVGYYFYTISEFEVQGNPNITDVFIQGSNPGLSEQLIYDTMENPKMNKNGTPHSK